METSLSNQYFLMQHNSFGVLKYLYASFHGSLKEMSMFLYYISYVTIRAIFVTHFC